MSFQAHRGGVGSRKGGASARAPASSTPPAPATVRPRARVHAQRAAGGGDARRDAAESRDAPAPPRAERREDAGVHGRELDGAFKPERGRGLRSGEPRSGALCRCRTSPRLRICPRRRVQRRVRRCPRRAPPSHVAAAEERRGVANRSRKRTSGSSARSPCRSGRTARRSSLLVDAVLEAHVHREHDARVDVRRLGPDRVRAAVKKSALIANTIELVAAGPSMSDSSAYRAVPHQRVDAGSMPCPRSARLRVRERHEDHSSQVREEVQHPHSR